MAVIEYPLHRDLARYADDIRGLCNLIKLKTNFLVINDSVTPPIQDDVTKSVPENLGSYTHPWKNLFVSGKTASELSRNRGEVIDVYDKLSHVASQTDVEAVLRALEEVQTRVNTLDHAMARRNEVEITEETTWNERETVEAGHKYKFYLVLKGQVNEVSNIEVFQKVVLDPEHVDPETGEIIPEKSERRQLIVDVTLVDDETVWIEFPEKVVGRIIYTGFNEGKIDFERGPEPSEDGEDEPSEGGEDIEHGEDTHTL